MKLFDDINDYDKIIISYSGGKDSTAMVLKMLDQGVNPDKVELWHQSIDGQNNTHKNFFDWPSTHGYVQAFAKQFSLRLGWQWRDKGFWKELHRNNEPTGNVHYYYEDDKHERILESKQTSLGTRLKFPAKTASLSTRWCSSYTKIDPARRVITNIYKGNKECPPKILFLTGERREESAARSKYDEIADHPSNTKSRLVHQWRYIIDMKEQTIWDLLEKYRILPHPAYYLGLPRLSCRSCIFFTPNHWATLNEVDPTTIKMLRAVEENLNFTIDNKYTLTEMVTMGKSKLKPENHKYVKLAVKNWTNSVIVPKNTKWTLPAGAFGTGGGAI